MNAKRMCVCESSIIQSSSSLPLRTELPWVWPGPREHGWTGVLPRHQAQGTAFSPGCGSSGFPPAWPVLWWQLCQAGAQRRDRLSLIRPPYVGFSPPTPGYSERRDAWFWSRLTNTLCHSEAIGNSAQENRPHSFYQPYGMLLLTF